MPQLDPNCAGCQKMSNTINMGATYGPRRMRGQGGYPRFYRGGNDEGKRSSLISSFEYSNMTRILRLA